MSIAYAMLNQTIAGTIALVDIDKNRLEGEAKDLEQGSAFHQYVRIEASDEYVSLFIMIKKYWCSTISTGSVANG
jgi:malate/lactate dehydrogenase